MRRLATTLAAGLLALLAFAPAASAQRAIQLNPSGSIPANVDSARFAELARVTSGGWRLRLAGTTTRPSGRRDGANVLGFSSGLPNGVLGAYEAWGRRYYARTCRNTSRGRTCRRVLRERILEADVSVSTSFNWQQGPAYPNSDQIDLESVMVHELGHYADPRAPHRRGCANSPLVDSLGSGEWWRRSTDWYRRGCANSPRNPASVGAARARSATRAARASVRQHRFAHVYHWSGPAAGASRR